METDGLHAREMNGIYGSTVPIWASPGAAKMRGYQVTGHTDPEASHSLAETGEEDSEETFEMILYLK